MRYIVGEYHDKWMAHKCTDDQGREVYIDLMVNGDFKVNDDIFEQFIKDLVGHTVEIDMAMPFVSIGHGVKIVNERAVKEKQG